MIVTFEQQRIVGKTGKQLALPLALILFQLSFKFASSSQVEHGFSGGKPISKLALVVNIALIIVEDASDLECNDTTHERVCQASKIRYFAYVLSVVCFQRYLNLCNARLMICLLHVCTRSLSCMWTCLPGENDWYNALTRRLPH